MAGTQSPNQQNSTGSVPIWLIAVIVLVILFACIIVALLYQQSSFGGGAAIELPTQAAVAEAPSITPSRIGGPTATSTWTSRPTGTPYLTPTFVNTAIAPNINTRAATGVTGGNIIIISGGSGGPVVVPTVTRAIPRSTQTAVAAKATEAISETRIAGTATQFAATATQAAATVTSAAASVTPVPGAWRGDYYNNKNLENPIVMVREDFIAPINNIFMIYNWGSGSPDPKVNNDNFSARWRYNGNFNGANYLFYAFSDDGVRVYVDGNNVINQWSNATNNVLYGNRSVNGGQRQVQVEYFEDKGDARIAVGWQLAQENAWIGEYYANGNLGQPPVYINQDNTIDFNWQQGSPSALPSDNFSIRWFRDYNFGSSALYRFTVHVDDGVRVKVGNTTIIDEWHTVNSPQTYTADRQLSGTQKVTVEYFEGNGNAQIQLVINPITTTATATATTISTFTPTPTATATGTATSTPTNTPTSTSTATNTPNP